jgi:hypothetical protein
MREVDGNRSFPKESCPSVLDATVELPEKMPTVISTTAFAVTRVKS